MPRKTPLGEREAAICERLQEFRKQTGLSRIAFAQKLRIDSSILVRYEHGRVPLRCDDFIAIHVQFGINPQWLVTGEGNPVRGGRLGLGVLSDCSPRSLFSDAYDKTLAAVCEDPAVEIHESIDQLNRAADEVLRLIQSRRARLGKSMAGVEAHLRRARRYIADARTKSTSVVGARPGFAQLVPHFKNTSLKK